MNGWLWELRVTAEREPEREREREPLHTLTVSLLET